MDTQKTYRLFVLWLAYLVSTATLLAKGQVPQAFEDKAVVKVELSLERAKQASQDPANQSKLPLKVLAQKVLQPKEKVPSLSESGKSIVQPLKSPIPSSSLSLLPVLNCGFGIVFASFEYCLDDYKPSIALLPYFENIFSHFIVINAP